MVLSAIVFQNEERFTKGVQTNFGCCHVLILTTNLPTDIRAGKVVGQSLIGGLSQQTGQIWLRVTNPRWLCGLGLLDTPTFSSVVVSGVLFQSLFFNLFHMELNEAQQGCSVALGKADNN